MKKNGYSRIMVHLSLAGLAAVALLLPVTARAGDAFRFLTPQSWAVGESITTYQEWDVFTSTSSNAPDVGLTAVPAAGGASYLTALPPAAVAGSGNFYAFAGGYNFRANIFNNAGTTNASYGTHVMVQTAATLGGEGGTVLPGTMEIVDQSGAPLAGGDAASALRYDIVYNGLVSAGPAGTIMQREELWEFYLPGYVGDFRVQASMQQHASLRQVRIDTEQSPLAQPLAKLPALHPESDAGDFSGDGNAPTPLGTLGAGLHLITAHFGDDGDNNDDSDIFNFEVPAGYEITSIKVLSYETSGDGGAGAFFAIADSSTIGITIPTATNHLSNMLIAGPGELMETLATSAFYGSTRMTPHEPLPAGPYSIFISETTAAVDIGLAITISRVPLVFQLLAWDDSSATAELPSAAGLKPSAPMPTAGDWLIFTGDDQALPAANNPAGALSHNFADITGAGGSGFNMAPSLTGTLSLRLEPASSTALGVTVTELAYTGQANAMQWMNQFLVARGDAATTNEELNVNGEGNTGLWRANAANNWAIQFALDFYFATNADGNPDPADIDATFNDKLHTGFLIPVSQLTSNGLASANLDDPVGLYGDDFESYLLEQIAPRLPTNATYLLVVQMGKVHPDYAELGLPITASTLIGNTTIAYTTQTLADAPELRSLDLVDDQPAVRFTGNLGLGYTIQRSDDLVNWEEVSDPALAYPEAGSVEWVDEDAIGNHQFYRLLPVTP